MEIIVTDYHQKKGIYNFTIQDKKINGITGTNQLDIIEIILLKHKYKGKVIINNQELTKENINNYKRKIYIIKEQIDKKYYSYKVYEYMYEEIKRKKIEIKDPKKKIIDSLTAVDLDISYLNRNIRDLSSSEKKLFQLSLSFLSNPELIILEDFINIFDLKTEKYIMLLLQRLAEYYGKTIILCSNNTDFLYQYTAHIIITKPEEIIVEGKTEEVLQRVDFLKRNGIKIPEKVEWTYIAKKEKKVKIDYHKDVRDMIKDIYKHV